MHIKKPCKICRQEKFFNVPKTKKLLETNNKYTICQRCRNIIQIVKDRQRRFGRVSKEKSISKTVDTSIGKEVLDE